jgi:molybdate/tungstate transport system substrate-binding protein
VLYAGSLVHLMESTVGPAFSHATGDGYQGYGAASQSIANVIKGRVKAGDVFISASPAVDDTLIGPRNGDWVKWYATFASAPLVLGYSVLSHFAPSLHHKPWYDVLQQPGIRIGITDPTLDPKGKLTVEALAAAQRTYRLAPTFANTIERKATTFPEQDLLGRLQAGQLDVGFFYTSEAKPAGLHTISLGRVHEAATFTVTVLQRAADPIAGAAFVQYLLTAARPALAAGGLRLSPPRRTGSPTAVPVNLRPVLAQ